MGESMQGVWLEQGELSLRAGLEVPDPPPGEALLRLLAAGICNTDLELLRGYYPYRGILGHEFVAVVEAGPPDLVGRRVVGEINAVCGRCRACRAARPTHCENRTVLGIVGRNGAFADYFTLPVENLYPVPERLSTEAATFTEPLAAALEIPQQVAMRPEDRVLLVGDGKLAQLIARVLALTGCDLSVAGRHPAKLELLAGLGVRTIGGGDTLERASFDVAVEATGSPDGFETARGALRPRGTLVLKSTYAGRLTLDASALVVDEITVVGSRCGPFAPALRLLAEGTVDPTCLIHARYPLREALAAFEHAGRPGVLKVLLQGEGV